MPEEITLMDVLTQFEPAVWCGVIAGLITFGIEAYLCVKGVLFSSGDKRLQRAKEAGRMLPAKMIRCRYTDSSPTNKTINRRYRAQYEYTFHGKKKTKQILTTGVEPPDSITLYYDEKGKKVFSAYDVGKNPLFLLVYIIPFLVAYVVMTGLGFDPS